MNGIAANSLADRLTWFIDGLCKTIGVEAQKRGVEAALAWAIWNRVRLLGARLIALAERTRAAGPRAVGAPRPAAGPRAPRSPRAQCAAAANLPQDFGWVKRLLPETAQWAGVLAYLLRDPEMAALLMKAPQAGRALRPLCHLLGVKAPEFAREGSDESFPPHLAAPRPGVERDVNDDVIAADHPSLLTPPSKGGGEGEMPPASLPAREGEGEVGGVVSVADQPPPAPRPLSWIEEDAVAMRERVARWVARHGHLQPPSTLLPLGMPSTLDFPGTRPFGVDPKSRR